jgi:catechol 2,3-dioxygenase-like lactoylglutathione lyase family enzyme
MRAVTVTGWEVCPDGRACVTEVLGASRATNAGDAAGEWSVTDPAGPGEPVGAPRALVLVTAAGAATVDVVPGSQGLAAPPDEAAVRTVTLEPGRDLVLDARCWFRRRDEQSSAVLFVAEPASVPAGGVRIVLDHVRLDVADMGASERFYADVLGLRTVVRYTTDTGVIHQMGPGGAPPGVELWRTDGIDPRPHPTHHLAFAVSDVPAVAETARRLGYRVETEPYAIGDETVAFLADPDGHLVEVNDFRGR